MLDFIETAVTPEMASAGVLALYDPRNDEAFNSPEERVTKVFLAMVRAKAAATEPADRRTARTSP
jgi:hypothetical protein